MIVETGAVTLIKEHFCKIALVFYKLVFRQMQVISLVMVQVSRCVAV